MRKVKIAVLIAVLALISSGFLHVEAQGQFVGSINSDVYHYPSCTYASRIKPENRIWFADATDAVNHGYRPCKVCNPPLPDTTSPVANSGSDQTVNEDIQVQFNGAGSTDNIGITSFVWTLVDSTPRTLYGDAPTYTFSSPGVYVVTLNVSDAAGNWDTDTVTITVLARAEDITPPSIGTPSRTPSADVDQGQEVRISVSIIDSGSGIKNASIFYTINNGSTWETPRLMTYDAITHYYETTIPGQTSGTWVKYGIRAYDNAGNTQTEDSAGQYFAFKVIPEYQALSTFLLILVAATLAVMAFRRKHTKSQSQLVG